MPPIFQYDGHVIPKVGWETFDSQPTRFSEPSQLTVKSNKVFHLEFFESFFVHLYIIFVIIVNCH